MLFKIKVSSSEALPLSEIALEKQVSIDMLISYVLKELADAQAGADGEKADLLREWIKITKQEEIKERYYAK